MPVHRDHNEATVRVELIPNDITGGSVIKQTVALQVWTNVSVTEEVSIGLSVFEQFTVKCLLQLGECRTEDICEVIGVGPELARWWLDGVETIGLARRIGESIFEPDIDSCLDALANNAVQKQVDTEKTMVWFPQTGELLVLQQHDTLLKALSKIDPTSSFPLPDQLVGAIRGDIVQNSLDNSLLYGNETFSIVASNDKRKIDDRMCPAYQLEMNISHVDGAAVMANIYGYPSQKSSRRQNEKRGIIKKSIYIPRLSKFVNISRERVRSLGNRLGHAMKNEGLLDPKIQDDSSQATLNYEKAREMAEQALLDCNKRITFVIDGEVEYEIPLLLVHSDDRVATLINLDAAVKRILTEKASTSILAEICEEFGVTQKDVVLRLWRLKQYAAIYQLREEQDFFE